MLEKINVKSCAAQFRRFDAAPACFLVGKAAVMAFCRVRYKGAWRDISVFDSDSSNQQARLPA